MMTSPARLRFQSDHLYFWGTSSPLKTGCIAGSSSWLNVLLIFENSRYSRVIALVTYEAAFYEAFQWISSVLLKNCVSVAKLIVQFLVPLPQETPQTKTSSILHARHEPVPPLEQRVCTHEK